MSLLTFNFAYSVIFWFISFLFVCVFKNLVHGTKLVFYFEKNKKLNSICGKSSKYEFSAVKVEFHLTGGTQINRIDLKILFIFFLDFISLSMNPDILHYLDF